MPTFRNLAGLAPGRRAFTAATLLAIAALATAQAQEIKIAGTGAALGTWALLAQAYAKAHPQAKVTVLPSMGSGGGIKAVMAGAVQIGLSSRPLSEAEAKAGAVATEYGRTPFVFATAAANKASGVNTQHLVDFYAGKVDEWPDGTKLRLVLRPIGDSDSETIKTLSPAMREAASAAEQRKGMVVTVTDQDTANALEKVPGTVGPTTLALLLSEKRPLKALALNGVPATAQNLANGSYPLGRPMWAVTGPKTTPEAQAFAAFVRSKAGREILRQTGHWVP